MEALALLYTLVKPFLGELLIGLGALATMFVVFLKGKNAGKKAEQDKQLKASYENEQKRNTIEDRVSGASSSERERLHNKWYRD